MTQFDFKEWADLYQVDPEAFEQRREAVLEGYVSSVDPAHRLSLEQTLFRIRMIRQRSKSPLQSAIESSKLMWESFGKLREEVEKLQQEATPAPLEKNSLRLINPSSTALLDQPSKLAVSSEDPPPLLPSAQVFQFKASGKRAH